jgi:hypothetical protein
VEAFCSLIKPARNYRQKDNKICAPLRKYDAKSTDLARNIAKGNPCFKITCYRSRNYKIRTGGPINFKSELKRRCRVIKRKFYTMKNPFEKNDHKVLIAGVAIGSAVAGAIAYLFLTETGATVRKELTGHINRIRDAVMGVKPAAPEEEHPADYMHPKPKAPKTDRAALKKHEIIGDHEHQAPGEAEGA